LIRGTNRPAASPFDPPSLCLAFFTNLLEKANIVLPLLRCSPQGCRFSLLCPPLCESPRNWLFTSFLSSAPPMLPSKCVLKLLILGSSYSLLLRLDFFSSSCSMRLICGSTNRNPRLDVLISSRSVARARNTRLRELPTFDRPLRILISMGLLPFPRPIGLEGLSWPLTVVFL